MSTLPRQLVLVLTLLVSCGHPPPKPKPQQAESSKVPVALLVEKEISGAVLGKPLSRPFGLAVDTRGVVYVCDAGNNRVLKLNLDLTADGEVGGFGASEGLFNQPSFVAVDYDLNLLVSDEGNRRICRYNSYLQFVEALDFYDAEDPLKFGYPSGVNLSDYGEVWAADRDRNRIVIFNNVGVFDRFIGEFGYPGRQLLSPEKIVRSRQGEFVVCDAGNSRLVIYDEYGNFLREIKISALEYPIAAISVHGRLWVLDGVTGKIHLIDGSGREVFEAGPTLVGSERALKEPSDIVMLTDGRLLISDSGNDRLLVCRIVFDER